MLIRSLIVLLCFAACTDARLDPVPPPPPPETDNRLQIKGEVCTEPADVSPFPVKILFVLDQSSSLQCTDSTNRRFDALRDVLDDLVPMPNAYFGFLGFAQWTRKQTFTRNLDEIAPFLDPSRAIGSATDYQGALASTLQLLEQDMIDAGPAERARTRYVVVFVSDGNPEPRCNKGCEDDERKCSDGVDSDGDGLVDMADPDCENIDDNSLAPDNLYQVCNVDNVREGDYVDMQGRCPQYNHPRQILRRIEEIRTLEPLYSVGELMFHSVLISSSQEIVNMICGSADTTFGYNVDLARDLLTEMARVGGGTFRDVNIADDDASFLDFDFTSLRTPYHATGFVASNQNAIPGSDGLQPDTDGDGLSDAEERRSGTQMYARDSDDNDGYSDLFEVRFRQNGFDPLDPSIPALPCENPEDSDGDGLNDCEEAFLELDPRNPDTDGDRILDGAELRAGIDPSTPDAERDPDYDGIINRSEIQGNTNPNSVDGDRFQKERVRYILSDTGEKPIPNMDTGEIEERRCYNYEVSELELAVTEQRADRGRNRILLQVFGEPLGLSGSRATIRQACIEVKYPGEGIKRPESGVVDLSDTEYSQIKSALLDPIDALQTCTGIEDMIRPDVEDVVDRCLPARQLVGKVLLHRDELSALLKRYYARDLSLALPSEASDFFMPIEIFDGDEHCYRAWEIDRILDLMQIIVDRCNTCETLNTAETTPTGVPDGSTGAEPSDDAGASAEMNE